MDDSSPLNSRLVWIVCLTTGVAVAFISASENYLTGIMVNDISKPYLRLLTWSLVFWGGWGVLAPFVVHLSSRNLLDEGTWRPTVLRLLVAAVVFWMIHTLIEASAMRLVPYYRDLHGGTFAGAFVAHTSRSWHINLLVFGGVAALTQGITWYRRYREQETDAARMQAAVAEAEIHALKMKLHPHFLFNALHSISTLMHRDVEAADKMLIELSDVLRSTIESSRSELATLDEEITFLRKYLAVEEVRFRDRLIVNIDVPDDLGSALIPNLILQPLVENAFKHGFEPKSGRFELGIRARRSTAGQGDRLIIEVEDDGAGHPADGTLVPGVGLTLTRDRLELMYDGRASLDVVSRDEEGVLARIDLPLERRHSTTTTSYIQ